MKTEESEGESGQVFDSSTKNLEDSRKVIIFACRIVKRKYMKPNHNQESKTCPHDSSPRFIGKIRIVDTEMPKDNNDKYKIDDVEEFYGQK